jgi:hypothetical protein
VVLPIVDATRFEGAAVVVGPVEARRTGTTIVHDLRAAGVPTEVVGDGEGLDDAVAGFGCPTGNVVVVVAATAAPTVPAPERYGLVLVVDRLDDVVVLDPRWLVEPAEALSPRAADALLTLVGGRVGVRGRTDPTGDDPPWLTLVSSAWGIAADGVVRPLPGPSLGPLEEPGSADPPRRRLLDLRSGLLLAGDGTRWRSARLASAVRPGVVAIRARLARSHALAHRPLVPPELGASAPLAATSTYRAGPGRGGSWWAETAGDRTSVTAVARQRITEQDESHLVERVAVFGADTSADELASALGRACRGTFDDLVREHRDRWRDRWDHADITIDGDDGSQRAVRFAISHLLASAVPDEEAAIGARGLTGLAYAGHVFWDTDVFVLPALSAIDPAAARGVVEYRLHRLDTARAAARATGADGARFPWESADSGEDVTPPKVRLTDGTTVRIRTGTHERHITADVAWAVDRYLDWTGDDLLEPACRTIVVEAARFWASQVRVDREGRGHIDGVMGPDEYHEVVDDDMFTNVMARWNLRRGAELVGVDDPGLASRWRGLADALVDGYDPKLGGHEQCAGFRGLEPLRIGDVAPVPVAADLLLGRSRVARSQVVKQPAVLMAHHLVPEDLPPGSLPADLDTYLPLTAHGSSLSPAICASLLARAGRPDEAMALFDLAAAMDLDDLAGSTGAGLHLATMGGLWQAVVTGFCGIGLRGGVLVVDPHLPRRWRRVEVRLVVRGKPVRVEVDHATVRVDGATRWEVAGR